MGKKSKQTPPPAPDYTAVAEKQGQASQDLANQQTWANRANVKTPWGSEDWTAQAAIDPSTGKPVTTWNQNINLTPESQAALQQQMDLQKGRTGLAGSFMNRVASDYSQPFDWNNLPARGGAVSPGQLQTQIGDAGPLSRGVGGSKDYVSRAENAIYEKAASRLNPQWERSQANLETQLANRGITRGSSAYARELENFNRNKTDAYNQATMGSIIGGGQEASRLQGMDIGAGQFGNQAQQQAYNQLLSSAGFGNQAQGQQFGQNMQASQYANQLRQQAIAEEAQRRGMSLNEMNALMTGQQVNMPQMPGYNTAGIGQTPNYLGAAGMQYDASMDQYNAQQARRQGLGSSIGSLIGGGLGFLGGGPMGGMAGASIGGGVGGGFF